MTNRREFLKKSAMLAGAGLLMPSLLAEGRAAVSASDKINVGLIGCRGMGWSDLSDFLIHPEVNCVAVCDVDSHVLREAAAKVERMRGTRPQQFADYRRLLELNDVDAVIIGTPDHWHCLQLADACAAGKDVYVEKPVANSIVECDLMVEAARRYNRVVQVGQQQRSGSHWHEMKAYIDSGRLGKISKVNVWANFRYAFLGAPVADKPVPEGVDYDMWLGPAPQRPFNEKRFHGSWRMFWDYGGGLLTDWGVHLLDMALWGMNVTGMPQRVCSLGGRFAGAENAAETFDTQTVTYLFPDFLLEWSHDACSESGPYGKNYGVEFKGENGSLFANRQGWQVYPAGNRIEAVEKAPDYDDHKKHVRNFLDCLKARRTDTACTLANGALCAKYAHLGNIAARTGESLVYDDERHTFRNREADAYLEPRYRRPWKLPKL